MDYEKQKEKYKKLWMDINSYKSQTAVNNILPLRPDVGYYIKVEGLDVVKDYFPEEFKQIEDAYFSIMAKLDEHYKTNK